MPDPTDLWNSRGHQSFSKAGLVMLGVFFASAPIKILISSLTDEGRKHPMPAFGWICLSVIGPWGLWIAWKAWTWTPSPSEAPSGPPHRMGWGALFLHWAV